MKRQTLKLILIALMVLGIQRANTSAETEDVKSSKSELKLVYELTLPECITAFSVKKGRDGKNEIDKALTVAGIYEIDDKKQANLIKKRTQELPVKTRCYPSSESFSPDGRYVVFCDESGERSKTFVIYDFKNNSSSQIKAGLFGAFSNQSVMFHTDMYQTIITDFSGNMVSEHAGMLFIKGFENGFICYGIDGDLYFINSDGQIVSKKRHHSRGLAYDVAYKNGNTAIMVPSESTLTVYDSSGDVKHIFNVPFQGHYAGIGITSESEDIIIVNSDGWIKFFDVSAKKELWTKSFKWGPCFVGSGSPVPISADGKYIIVYGDLDEKESPTWSMIILDQFGKVVALFDAPRDRGYMVYYYIDFIPETNKIVGFTDNTLSVYEIVERD